MSIHNISSVAFRGKRSTSPAERAEIGGVLVKLTTCTHTQDEEGRDHAESEDE